MNINSFLSKLFGNKAQKDRRAIQPYVDKIRALAPEMEKLSNDELRSKTAQIRNKIKMYVGSTTFNNLVA